MSRSWLMKKRKGELLDLAVRADVPDATVLLKDDLVTALEETLQGKESIYAKQPGFSEYYERAASPIKRERFSPEVQAVARPRRRQTLVKTQEVNETSTPEKSEKPEKPEKPFVSSPLTSPPLASPALASPALASSPLASTPTAALTTRTPRSVSSALTRRVSEVDIPASPSQLADVADQSFQVVKEKATELWDRSRIDEWKEYIRENVSSVAAIQTLILLIEATGLQYNTLSTIYAFDSPSNPSLGLHSRGVHLPDVSALLTSDWWAPATLWSLTSWVLPLICSYFVNLTLKTNTHHKSSARETKVDPLTFNIVKALLAYSAFHISTQADVALAGQPNAYVAQNIGWGPFDQSSVSKVRNNVPGGYPGLQIGAFVGILFSLYDAALKK